MCSALWNMYMLYSSALNTQLVDNTFPEEDFEVVLGSLEVKWQRIGPYPFTLWLSTRSVTRVIHIHNSP